MPATRRNPYLRPERPALVDGLILRCAELEAENAALRARVAQLTEFERIRAYDRSARASRRWKGLDR